jgi:hypothetical protein
MSDPVLKPAHYNAGRYETIDVIEDSLTPEMFQGYCKGNALKYVLRSDKKHADKPTEDLRKAIWYLDRAVRSINLQANGATVCAMQQEEYAPHGAKVHRQYPKPRYDVKSGPHFI